MVWFYYEKVMVGHLLMPWTFKVLLFSALCCLNFELKSFTQVPYSSPSPMPLGKTRFQPFRDFIGIWGKPEKKKDSANNLHPWPGSLGPRRVISEPNSQISVLLNRLGTSRSENFFWTPVLKTRLQKKKKKNSPIESPRKASLSQPCLSWTRGEKNMFTEKQS